MTINENTRAITMIRGDDESITLRRYNKEGKHLPFAEGESLTMTVREDAESDIAFQIRAERTAEGDALFPIAHADTEGLDFGRYVYDIQYTSPEGIITTYIPLSKFTLKEEVTY